MKRGTLLENDALRNHCVGYIQETSLYLSTWSEFIWDNLQFLRYNFCVIVRSIAQELQFQDHLFDKVLVVLTFVIFEESSPRTLQSIGEMVKRRGIIEGRAKQKEVGRIGLLYG